MKKIFSLIMACLLVFSVFAVSTSAASTKAISKIEVTFSDSGVPKAPSNAHYTISSIYYFAANGVKGCTFNVSAKKGYAISNDAVMYVNGENSSSTLLVSTEFSRSGSVVVLRFSNAFAKIIYSNILTSSAACVFDMFVTVSGRSMMDGALVYQTAAMKMSPATIHEYCESSNYGTTNPV